MKKQKTINIATARAKLTELVDRASLSNEEFVITKSGKARVKITNLTEKDKLNLNMNK